MPDQGMLGPNFPLMPVQACLNGSFAPCDCPLAGHVLWGFAAIMPGSARSDESCFIWFAEGFDERKKALTPAGNSLENAELEAVDGPEGEVGAASVARDRAERCDLLQMVIHHANVAQQVVGGVGVEHEDQQDDEDDDCASIQVMLDLTSRCLPMDPATGSVSEYILHEQERIKACSNLVQCEQVAVERLCKYALLGNPWSANGALPGSKAGRWERWAHQCGCRTM